MTTTATRPSELALPREVSEAFSETGAIHVPSTRPTPLIGSWADESWPLGSRQNSEVPLEAVQRQRSSIIFENEQGNEFTFGDEEAPADDVDDLHSDVDAQSELDEQLSVAQPSMEDLTVSSLPTSPSITMANLASVHVTRCYKFDPYNINGGIDVMYCCYCERCTNASAAHLVELNRQVEAEHEEVDEVEEYRAEPYYEEPAAPQQHPRAAPRALGASPLGGASGSFSSRATPDEWDAPQNPHPSPSSQVSAARPNGGGFATHLNTTSAVVPPPMHHVPATAGNSSLSHLSALPVPQNQQGPLLTSFMPPSPPPRIMALVMEEEGTKTASGIYYHVLTRWYSHVVEAQEFFVSPEDYCPPPNKELYSFDEWADQVSGWWYTHFEHRQKKQPRFPNVPGAARRQ